jgi:ELWxxDGT repeat protein
VEDGTPAGTAEVNPPTLGDWGFIKVSNLTAVNGTLYFDAIDANSGQYELWKSDGTTAGTFALMPGYATDMTATANGTLLFNRASGPYDPTQASLYARLWRSDGTAAGAFPLKGLTGTGLTTFNGRVYFAARTGIGNELFVTDGTLNGTVPVADINPGPGDSNPTGLAAYNGALYFTANDGTHGAELWKTDGTTKGTVLVDDINPGVAGSLPPGGYDPTASGGALYFAADDGSHGAELWKTDGAAAGTVMVTDINPGLTTPASEAPHSPVSAGSSEPSLLTDVNGMLFFTADDGTHGTELWASDGTAAGTRLVTDLTTTVPGSGAANLANVNGTLFFTADDGIHGTELWKTDGTAAGTVMVKDINAGPKGSDPTDLTAVSGTLFFWADDGVHGKELWMSDGTAAGTVMVMDINPGPHSSYPPDTWLDPHTMMNANGLLYFLAANNDAGLAELWLSDGTAAGTYQLTGQVGVTDFRDLDTVAIDGTLFFPYNDGVHGKELWKTDGTLAGTVLVKDIFPAGQGSYPNELTNVNGTLFFVANDGAHGPELWKSDGTVAGTGMVKDIDLGAGSIYPTNLTSVNGTLYFTGGDGVHSPQLWKSDGTAAGTVEVAAIPSPRNPDGDPTLVSANGKVFIVTDGLWVSDGTAAGTSALPGVPGEPFNLTIVNGLAYFTAGAQLWQSDGTAAGTQPVAGIDASPTCSPTNVAAVNGTVFFAASDGIHGQQLWKTVAGPAVPPLSASGKAISVAEGQTFSGTVATFTDPGPAAAAGTYAALITWGDGQTSAGTITALGNGQFSVSGSHVYAHAGSYAVSVQIKRAADGSGVRATAWATVAEEPFWAGRTYQHVKKGQAVAGLLGSLTDLNLAAAAGDFTMTIDWGDGSTSTGLLLPKGAGKFDIGGTHTYSSTGLKTLTMTVTDEAGRAVTAHPLIAVDF